MRPVLTCVNTNSVSSVFDTATKVRKAKAATASELAAWSWLLGAADMEKDCTGDRCVQQVTFIISF